MKYWCLFLRCVPSGALAIGFATLVVSLAPLGACGSTSAGFASFEGGVDPNESVDANAPGLSLGDASSDSIGACVTCSNDLRQVLDCNGNVLKTCSGDLGCANGGCIPGCDAAKAN